MGIINNPIKDIAAPNPPKSGKEKPKRNLGPKLVPNDPTKLPAPGIGHNGGAHPEVVAAMDETLGIDEQIKALGKAKRDLRNRMKTEFGILAWNWNHEVSMRKKDKDVRIQLESGAMDLKNMLGYQAALDLQPHTTARTEEEYADPVNKITPDAIVREG